MAQWKRAGPITQRSVDRNYALLETFLIFRMFRRFSLVIIDYKYVTKNGCSCRIEFSWTCCYTSHKLGLLWFAMVHNFVCDMNFLLTQLYSDPSHLLLTQKLELSIFIKVFFLKTEFLKLKGFRWWGSLVSNIGFHYVLCALDKVGVTCLFC